VIDIASSTDRIDRGKSVLGVDVHRGKEGDRGRAGIAGERLTARAGYVCLRLLLSTLALLKHEPSLFRSERPVNRALGFCHSLRFNRSLSSYGNSVVQGHRPFPHLPPDALNDRIFDAAIFHFGKNRNAFFGS
jgi:hypothetical protein